MTKDDWGNIIHDKVSYERFYVEYFKKLYNYGKKFTANTSLIEDSIQEIFLDLWRKRQKIEQVHSINSYLFSSFRYTLLRKITSDKKTISRGFDIDGVEPSFSMDSILIDRDASKELQHKLNKALAALTPHQREAIFLRFYQNLTYEEVAGILNISVKATYKIMARSLIALKNNMAVSVTFLLIMLHAAFF